MTQRTQELLFAGAVLAVFVVYAFLSLEFGPNARMIPLPMAALGCVLTIAQLVRLAARDAGTVSEADEVAASTTDSGNRELCALGGIACAVVLILVVGPVTAIFLFTGSYLFASGHFAAPRSLVIAALFTAALYLLFVVGLQLELYHGILAPLVAPTP